LAAAGGGRGRAEVRRAAGRSSRVKRASQWQRARCLPYPRPVTAVESVPEFVEPMLLTATAELPDDDSWVHEVKWDGMRAQLRFDGRRVTVRSRHGRDCTEQFPELLAIAGALNAP